MIGKKSRLWGAILLVSGTTIGAAMLALPVTTGQAGFFPSLAIMTGIWLFMMLTAFLLLEVNLRMPGESNLISMASKTLGRWGQIVAWLVYLLLLYSLLAAYMMGCSQTFEELLASWLPFAAPFWFWPSALFLFFALFIFWGTELVDIVNRTLMVGLASTFMLLLFWGLPRVHPPLLMHADWRYLLPSTSVVLTTFGYHIIIPTLTTYLEHDEKRLRQAIFIGSLIPFLFYLLWQTIVMGIVPAAELAQEGPSLTAKLYALLQAPGLTLCTRLFSLFSIITSLLGVSLSLSDFLADGLRIEKQGIGKVGIVLLTFLPPLFFGLFYPTGFVHALKYAGIFVVVLLALLPAWMAWYERYGPQTARSLLPPLFQVPGGKSIIVLTMLISLALLVIEVWV